MESTMTILKELTDGYMEQERKLEHKYPWAEIIYNWMLFLAAVGLVISLFCWGVDSYNTHKENANTAAKEAAQEAEKIAAEEEAQKEFEEMLERWAEAGAKMLWGIRDFRNLYGYTAKDLETYLRCAWNRYLEGKKLTDIETIIFKDDQFTGCYRTNAAPDRDKNFARTCFEKFIAEEVPACDTSYTFAELTPNGIFLSNVFNADGYVQRWHA